MKRLLISTLLAGALAGPIVIPLALPLAAQTADHLFRAEPGPLDMRASDLIGMRVYATETPLAEETVQGLQTDWQDIGEINDLILTRDGSVAAVLVDIGGFLGIGERQVAVQMPSLHFVGDEATADSANDFFLVLSANRALLESAPGYGMTDQAGTQAGTQTGDQVAGDAATTGDAAGGATTDTTGGTTTSDTAAGTNDTTAGTDTGSTETGSTAGSTAGSDTMAGLPEGYDAFPADQLTADMLQGSEVYDPKGDQIGEVSDLVLDDSGKITRVVIDVGGFLGIGEKRVALPLDQVQIVRSSETSAIRILVPHTEQQLKDMETFTKS